MTTATAARRASLSVRYSAQMDDQFTALAADRKGHAPAHGRPWARGSIRQLHDQALHEFLEAIDPDGTVDQFRPIPTSTIARSLYLDAEIVGRAREIARRFDLPVQTLIFNAFQRFLERHGSAQLPDAIAANSAPSSASPANAA